MLRHQRESCVGAVNMKTLCVYCNKPVAKSTLNRHIMTHINKFIAPRELVFPTLVEQSQLQHLNPSVPSISSSSSSSSKRPLEVDAPEAGTSTASPAKRVCNYKYCNVCDLQIPSRGFTGHIRSSRHKARCLEKIQDADGVFKINSGFKDSIAHYRVDLEPDQDIANALMSVENKLLDIVSKMIQVNGTIKFSIELFGTFVKYDADNQLINHDKSFNTQQKIISLVDDFKRIYSEMTDTILEKSEDVTLEGSGWALSKVNHVEINISKYIPISGSSYIPLPDIIKKKHACINVQNSDKYCFIYSILSVLFPVEIHPDRVSSYTAHFNKIKYEDSEFPMQLKNIRKFEKENNISVNVFCLSEKNEVEGPILLTNCRKDRHVNLLLLEDVENNRQHYCAIKDMSRLVTSQVTSHEHRRYFCDGCLYSFPTQEKLKQHNLQDCNHVATTLPTTTSYFNRRTGQLEQGNFIKFKSVRKQLPLSHLIYSDFETIIEPLSTQTTSGKSTTNTHKNIAHSFLYYIKCSYNDNLSKFVS